MDMPIDMQLYIHGNPLPDSPSPCSRAHAPRTLGRPLIKNHSRTWLPVEKYDENFANVTAVLPHSPSSYSSVHVYTLTCWSTKGQSARAFHWNF